MKRKLRPTFQFFSGTGGLWAIFTAATFLLLLSFPDATRGEENAPASQTPPSDWAVHKLVDLVREHQGKIEPFSIDLPAYQEELIDLPIGVFDSGIGGLSVLQALLTSDLHDNRTGQPGADGIPDFQNERFLYFGDQANLPYGNYPEKKKTDLLRELILKDVLFLLGNRYYESAEERTPRYQKPPVKAIVIACNTATAFGLEDIREALQEWGIPLLVVGVVEAGAGSVIDELPREGEPSSIAVLATMGTCQSNAYPRAIHQIAGQRGRRLPLVWQQGSLGLAGAIEGDPSFVRSQQTEGNASFKVVYGGPAVNHSVAPIDPALSAAYGFQSGDLLGQTEVPESWQLNSIDAYIRYDVLSLVESYRQAAHQQPIRHVVLGCTHFPFEQEKILAAFHQLRTYRDSSGTEPYRGLIAENLQLIDPAALTAKELYRGLFQQRRLIREASGSPRSHRFFVSVPHPDAAAEHLTADGWYSHEYKYGRSAGNPCELDTKIVPLLAEHVPNSIRQLIETHCPDVWQLVLQNR